MWISRAAVEKYSSCERNRRIYCKEESQLREVAGQGKYIYERNGQVEIQDEKRCIKNRMINFASFYFKNQHTFSSKQ